MIEEKIFTENPEEEMWRELLQFTYKANVKRFLKEHSLNEDEQVIDCIIGSFLQAYEYYKASSTVNLQISPLLLYYGTTNLLYGTITLLTGEVKEITHHGMYLDKSQYDKYIAETKVIFDNFHTGGLHVFARTLGYQDDLTKTGKWELKELLESIAEISSDYIKCYQKKVNNILMLDVFNTPTGKIEKIYYNSENENDILEKLGCVVGINKSYLRPQSGKEHNGREYYILRHKMAGEDISKISFSGQPYLQASIKKNGQEIEIPSLFNIYISLFIMGSLCRYQPQVWSPFVLNDETGERLVFEKVIYYARRMLPNMILNEIYKKKMTYVTEKYNVNETIKHVSEHEVQEIVKKEVFKQSQKDKIK